MATGPTNQDAVSIFLAEYEFVSQLIPFYRRIEMTALAGSAAVIGAVVAAISTMEGRDQPDRAAEATLLSLGSWVTVLLLLIQIMALTRIRRAALYIREELSPKAKELSGGVELLQWETRHSKILKASQRNRLLKGVAGVFVTSVPVTAAIFAPALAMPVVAGFLHPDKWDAPVLLPGYVALVISALIALYGIAFSWSHESDDAHTATHDGQAGC